MKKLTIAFFAVILCSLAAKAQDFSAPQYARFGESNEDRRQNITLYNYFDGAYKTKDYDAALGYMHQLIKNCPKVSMNLYINGGDIYRMKMSRAVSRKDKVVYLDSMMYLLDLRIKHFGTHKTLGKDYSLAQKAMIYLENNPADMAKALEYFSYALKNSERVVNPEMCRVFFNSLTESYKLDDITPEEYLGFYDDVMQALERSEQTAETEQATNHILNMFASSGAASCSNIESIFRPKYEADPQNADLVKKILALFSRSKCTSDFQMELAEKFYAIEPSADFAMMLGNIYSEKKEYTKALDYFEKAVDMESDATKKYNALTLAAGTALSAHQYSNAARFARNMISLNDDNGYGHLFLANAYAGGANGCSDFNKKAAYWLVVDAFVRARAKFEGNEQQTRNINQTINSYSAHFPNSEEVFMRGMSKGDAYNVNCGWLSGRTTVR